MRREVDWDDPNALDRVAEEARIEFQGDRVLLDGRDITALRRVRLSVHPGIRNRAQKRDRSAVCPGLIYPVPDIVDGIGRDAAKAPPISMQV